MLILLSPAKIQNFTPLHLKRHATYPKFINEAEALVNQLRGYSSIELGKILKVNRKIADENANHLHNFHTPFSVENAKPAIFAYAGEVFRGLDVETLNNDAIDYLQSHLRVFSSLYGVLRPLDLIQAYRLDQMAKLVTSGGENLYNFWKDRVTNEILNSLQTCDKPKIIANLASSEYFKMMDKKQLNCRIIDFEFLQYQPDTNKFKPITIYTKKARGLMTRFIATNQIDDPENLKAFHYDNYWFNDALSTNDKFVFVR